MEKDIKDTKEKNHNIRCIEIWTEDMERFIRDNEEP